MKAVADAAGISRQTLYNHYPDVDGIVVDSLRVHQQATLDELRTILATIESPSDRLGHLVRHAGAIGVHHHPTATLVQALSAEARSILDEYDQGYLAIVADTLRAGIETAIFRPDLDVARDARIVMRMLDATAELTAADHGRVHEIVTAATRTVMAAVAPNA